jgi:hypothetical protein
MVLIQANASSIRWRARWFWASPGWRVVRPSIGAAAAGVLRAVRRDPARAQLQDEVAGIEAAVSAERRRAGGRQPVEHGQRRQPLGVPRGAGQLGVDQEAATSPLTKSRLADSLRS